MEGRILLLTIFSHSLFAMEKEDQYKDAPDEQITGAGVTIVAMHPIKDLSVLFASI